VTALLAIAVFLWAIGSSLDHAGKHFQRRTEAFHKALEAQRANLAEQARLLDLIVNPPPTPKPRLVYKREGM
jgi:hypothetical protein